MSARAWDDVIVGAGSAGCVLAARLSEDAGRRVLLLEAGPDYATREALPPELRSPLRPTYTHEWGYVSERGRVGRSFKLPRGRVVGGCSATNAAVALRGAPSDYDGWAAAGHPDWGWDAVLPWFVALERDADFAGPAHGRAGPLAIRRWPSEAHTAAARAFLGACAAAGFAAAPDHNAPGALGAGPLPMNIEDGARHSAALAWLAPARARGNLEVRGGVLVDRVLFHGARATGVRLAAPAQEIAAGRVVLAAGSYGSPALLLRSGIGAAGALRALGVPVVADRAGVGEGLQDHPLVGLVYAARTPAAPAPEPIFQALLTTRSTACAGDFDLQLLPRTVMAAESSPTGATVMLFVSLVKPRARGRLALRGAAPDAAPSIDPGYFADPADLPRLVEGVRLARRLARTPPFDAVAGEELFPGGPVGDDDAALARLALARVETYHHPVGTCRMGPAADSDAVVDAFGAVHGVERLHVVDASILPEVPAANTHLATLMAAERCAAVLRAQPDRVARSG